jgi:transposase
MEPIPVRTRERIIALYEEGEQTSEISERTGYCPAAVRRVKQHLRERGTLEPLAGTPGPKGKLTDAVKERLRGLVHARPDATLAELRDALAAGAKVAASTSTIDRWLGKLGLSFKKSR